MDKRMQELLNGYKSQLKNAEAVIYGLIAKGRTDPADKTTLSTMIDSMYEALNFLEGVTNNMSAKDNEFKLKIGNQRQSLQQLQNAYLRHREALRQHRNKLLDHSELLGALTLWRANVLTTFDLAGLIDHTLDRHIPVIIDPEKRLAVLTARLQRRRNKPNNTADTKKEEAK